MGRNRKQAFLSIESQGETSADAPTLPQLQQDGGIIYLARLMAAWDDLQRLQAMLVEAVADAA